MPVSLLFYLVLYIQSVLLFIYAKHIGGAHLEPVGGRVPDAHGAVLLIDSSPNPLKTLESLIFGDTIIN